MLLEYYKYLTFHLNRVMIHNRMYGWLIDVAVDAMGYFDWFGSYG